MSVPYQTILRMTALKINAITGVSAADVETAYTTAPLTSTQVVSVDFPFSSIKDVIIATVGKIVRAYSMADGHPFRQNNTSQTASIPNQGRIPKVDSTNKSIIGTYGAIYDAATGEELTEQPLQLIRAIKTNTDGFLKRPYYHYKIAGGKLYHTVANAVIDVPVFDLAAENSNFATGNAPIPDVCLDLAMAGSVMMLVRDDEFVNQAQVFGNYFNQGLSDLMTGATTFAPAPSLINTAQPGIS